MMYLTVERKHLGDVNVTVIFFTEKNSCRRLFGKAFCEQ